MGIFKMWSDLTGIELTEGVRVCIQVKLAIHLLQMDCICSNKDRHDYDPKILVALHTFQWLASQVQLEALVFLLLVITISICVFLPFSPSLTPCQARGLPIVGGRGINIHYERTSILALAIGT